MKFREFLFPQLHEVIEGMVAGESIRVILVELCHIMHSDTFVCWLPDENCTSEECRRINISSTENEDPSSWSLVQFVISISTTKYVKGLEGLTKRSQ